MKKLLIVFSIVVMMLFNTNILGQVPDFPEDGEGDYLDEVPIDGEIYFILAAMAVGGFMLFKKHKAQITEFNQK